MENHSDPDEVPTSQEARSSQESQNSGHWRQLSLKACLSQEKTQNDITTKPSKKEDWVDNLWPYFDLKARDKEKVVMICKLNNDKHKAHEHCLKIQCKEKGSFNRHLEVI